MAKIDLNESIHENLLNQSPDVQLKNAIHQSGLTPPHEIIFDGSIHRFRGNDSDPDKDSWYIAFAGHVHAAHFGCWKSGVDETWREKSNRIFTAQDEINIQLKISESKERIKKEREGREKLAAEECQEIWNNANPATGHHKYLEKKNVYAYDIRQKDGKILIPLYNKDEILCSLQYINENGDKLFHRGGTVGGNFFCIGRGHEDLIYIAEGYATAATIYQETNTSCVIAFCANNIPKVCKELREMYGNKKEFVIIADKDKSGIGEKYALEASEKYGARVIVSPVESDVNDYMNQGGNLKELLRPKKSNWLVHVDEFSLKPQPIKWIIKNYLQENTFMMIHGAPGCGKTFLVIDWCMHIASGANEWVGHKVNSGNVVYLAGEGHHGLKIRIAAWKKYYNTSSTNMWVSSDGLDLDTLQGYQRTLENIKSLGEPIKLIVIDTLHRFLAGNENLAVDMKKFIDSCDGLIRNLNTSVLIVHHTGTSEEAKHRARGSNSLQGAVNIDMNLYSNGNDSPLFLTQNKMKDGETKDPLPLEFEKYTIPDWADDDGEPITSLIVKKSDYIVHDVKKENSKLGEHRKTFENAWRESGCDMPDGCAYVSKSFLRDFLSRQGITDRTVENNLNPIYKDKLIGFLINADLIEVKNSGFSVKNNEMNNILKILKMS